MSDNTTHVTKIAVIGVLLICILASVQFGLLGAKLDEKLEKDWAVVFVPSWILFGSLFIISFLSMLSTTCLKGQSWRTIAFLSTFAAFVSFGCIIWFLILTSEKLDHKTYVYYPSTPPPSNSNSTAVPIEVINPRTARMIMTPLISLTIVWAIFIILMRVVSTQHEVEYGESI